MQGLYHRSAMGWFGRTQNKPEHERRQSSAPVSLGRLDYLDAMRGIAALLVVLHHCYQTAPFWPDLVRLTPLRLLLNGRPSVIFFFVLSGFVLACGLWRPGAGTSFVVFVQRRLVRIYVPFLCAGGLAILGMAIVQPHPLGNAAITFNEMWRAPIDVATAVAHLAMVGTVQANSVNTPGWSLVYELRISLLLPLLCFIGARSMPVLIALSGLAYVGVAAAMAAKGLPSVPYDADGLVENALVTTHFVGFFVVGLLLARAAMTRAGWIYGMSRRSKIVLAIAGIGLAFVFRDETTALAASAFIVLALNTQGLQATLRHPVLQWLGQISFSLYLTHAIVLQLVVRALDGVLPIHLGVAAAMLAIPPVAVAFFHLVERPAHLHARRLGRSAPAQPQVADTAPGGAVNP